MKYNCTNWDKDSWLSSNDYFQSLTSFLTKKLDISLISKILDVGCGRGHLLNCLSNNFSFNSIPMGVEPVNHQLLLNKKFQILNLSIQDFLKSNTNKYDIIFLKQVIHLIPKKEREEILLKLKDILLPQGKLVILQMSESHEIPYFPLMDQKLKQSLSQNLKIEKELNNMFTEIQKEEYDYRVNISKQDYLKMIQNKFISTLFEMTNIEIEKGCRHIENIYPDKLIFNDKLDIYFVN